MSRGDAEGTAEEGVGDVCSRPGRPATAARTCWGSWAGPGGSNSRPSAPLGHEGGVRPITMPAARRRDGGQGRFRERASLKPRPSAPLGHEGVVRLGHGRGIGGRRGGREGQEWWAGKKKCAGFGRNAKGGSLLLRGAGGLRRPPGPLFGGGRWRGRAPGGRHGAGGTGDIVRGAGGLRRPPGPSAGAGRWRGRAPASINEGPTLWRAIARMCD